MPDNDLPKCAKCGAVMTDYDPVFNSADADPEKDVPDFAKCKACGQKHHFED